MHSDPQISLHEMASPFRLSHGGRIHRCCTAQFIYYAVSDKAAIHMESDTSFQTKCLKVLCVLASVSYVHEACYVRSK